MKNPRKKFLTTSIQSQNQDIVESDPDGGSSVSFLFFQN